ncbi:hypothetical protein [Caldinitratiruptor microaerophilus]|uniref:hypothetical protein n=1 Tax=Caldinitratiruptor microaerophilus TaxID=671077 RepID=UPI002230CB0B|nr:hypothetical protein [Caldinitratiruptor microaerophilus]
MGGSSGALGCLGFILVLFGVLLFLKVALAGGAAFLALAVGLGAAYYVGAAGRWALWTASVLVVLAIPWLVLQSLGIALGFLGLAIGLAAHLLPLALLAFGVYLIVRALR